MKIEAQEDLLLEADAARRIKGAVLRLADFYGPDVDKSFLPGAFAAARTGGVANLVGPPQALVDEIGRQAGRPVKVRVAGKWTLHALGLFNPFMREMVEMHYLLTEPVIMDDSALQSLIGPISKTPYPDGIRQTLAAAK